MHRRPDRTAGSARSCLPRLLLAVGSALVCLAAHAQGSAYGGIGKSSDETAASGPIRLQLGASSLRQPAAAEPRSTSRPAQQPGEFERFVQGLADQYGGASNVRRFGSQLMLPNDDDAADQAPMAPDNYVIKPGDEILLTMWGSVEADLRLVVDRGGRVTIPRVGPVPVAGARLSNLNDTIAGRVGQVFRNFQVAASLGQLRGIRVYVTGFAVQPGGYSANSLSTLVSVLAKAGGPSVAGSFRNIQLKRGDRVESTFDLYDLLLSGERGADRLLEAGDIIHVNAVGTQVAIIGSVNQPAIFELKPDERVKDVLRMAGGFAAVAERSRLAVEKLDDRNNSRVRELALPADLQHPLTQGDVLHAFSAVKSVLPVERQNKRVRIEGEVLRPGEYILPPNSSVSDALKAAGGMTSNAYAFGAEFTRDSVRRTQQQNYERALRDLETDLARSSAVQRSSNADEANALALRESANARLVARLRALQPNGRIVLQLEPEATSLPDLALEDGDRISIPVKPTTVGVFGSVFNSGSYLYTDGRLIGEYMDLAGGPTRGADADSVFVVRANGSVMTGGAESQRSWFKRNATGAYRAVPGDTIFVPEEMNKNTFIQDAKDWTQILYQFGLGVALTRSFR